MRGLQILCLPELVVTGYGCEDLFFTEWLPEKALDQLLKLLPFTRGMVVNIGIPLRFEGALYNTACLVYDGRIQGFAAKQLLAQDGVHYEPRWFTPWEPGRKESIVLAGRRYALGDLVFEVNDIKIAFEICEDAWREPRPASRHCKQGVQLIMNPSASHYAFGKAPFREKLITDSSLRFDCTYLYANLLGNEAGKMIYDGDLLIAAKGHLLQRNQQRLSMKDHQLIWHDWDPRNPSQGVELNIEQHYNRHEAFAKAVSLALFDYLRKSHSKGFVLSLSGGADSSACAVLVAHMIRRGIEELKLEGFLAKAHRTDLQAPTQKLPKEAQAAFVTQHLLTTAYQATHNSGPDTLESAQTLAQSLGATFYHWSVDTAIDYYRQTAEEVLGRQLNWQQDDIALQNIQSRGRAPMIWLLTNLLGGLLITTANRSEGDVGYATMDGDTSGGVAPIGGVDKHFILNWLRWAQEQGYEGLAKVNSLQPTAELRPKEMSQTDEADLMPYATIVEIERLAILEGLAPLQVYKTLLKQGHENPALLKQHIVRFFTLWARNQWKRERLAPTFHVDAFSVDPRSWYRFPILSGSYKEELAELEATPVPPVPQN